MKSIAHIREEDNCIQTNEEHLLGVKGLAEELGKKLNVKHLAGLAGMLHDLGKYSTAFTDYIWKAVYDPKNAPVRGSVDHSTAGGKLLYNFFHKHEKSTIYQKLIAEIIGNVIISHHSYLHDYLSPESITSPYLKRVRDKELEEFTETKETFFQKVMPESEVYAYVEKAESELKGFLKTLHPDELEFQMMFLTKYIYSCLIDADRTNTREFVQNVTSSSEEERNKETRLLFADYYQKLTRKLATFKQNEQAHSPINILRTDMSEQCEQFAKEPSGIYTLSIPTGGGKTLASFRYALKHAKKHDKKRIIYVVPYTTIIEQNAREIRDIVQDDLNVLEHHSNVIIDDPANEEDIYMSEKNRKLMLAKDNWDSPIVFTTMVQFLNVFYAHSSRNVRRLHNLAESIIIFDEVQKVPTHCVSLFNRSLNFLSKKANASIVLCTATQPALDYVEHRLNINPDGEIIKNLPGVIDAFKRVEVIDKASSEKYTNKKLTQFIFRQLEIKDSVLVILNTKSVVRNLFKMLEEQKEDNIILFHLSTSMCAAHRNDILEKVRKYLDKQTKLICISTQLIEAGVDISFDCVIRSLAGLDSIAQAAGRCNRHGEVDTREVYIIDHGEENVDRLKEIKTGKEITRKLLVDLNQDSETHGGDILSLEALSRYFQEFYTSFTKDLNYLLPKLNTDLSILLGGSRESNSFCIAYRNKWNESFPLVNANSYRTAARHFRVIHNETTPVIVPYQDGKDYIAQFNSYEKVDDLSLTLRKSQHYTVNLYEQELEQLKTNGQIESLMDGMILVLKEGAYDKKYGVEIEGDSPLGLSLF